MISNSMPGTMAWIFWICLAVLFYSYIGYGLLLAGWTGLRKGFRPGGRVVPERDPSEWPVVSLIIPAYNEENSIDEKIRNSREIEYPADKLEIIVVTDGSTDRTPERAREAGVVHLHDPRREGKARAMERAAAVASGSVLVFTDANCLLNPASVKKMVRHYRDSRVGGVAGEKRVRNPGSSHSNDGEGWYWRYESWLKRLDSQLHSTMGAAGELFSIRKDLFLPVPGNTIIEDFVLSLSLCIRGYRCPYEPEACCREAPAAGLKEDWKRKVRISAGAFQAMGPLAPLFNFFRRPLLAFMFISHRILRWTVCPLALPLLLVSSYFLAAKGPFYLSFFWLQIGSYALAFIGYGMESLSLRAGILRIPAYFCMVNAAVYVGFWRFLWKKQPVAWEKSRRR